MAHYVLPTPVSEEDIRKLRINDTVTLQNTLLVFVMQRKFICLTMIAKPALISMVTP